MQVYTLAYAKNGDFLLFTKMAKGYFFSSGGGGVLPEGKPLNGGGDFALPGGMIDEAEKSLKTAAQREFKEECSRSFQFQNGKLIMQNSQFKDGVAESFDILEEYTTSFSNKEYSAYYLELSSDDLNRLFIILSQTCLSDALLITRKIKSGSITAYSEIIDEYPYAPMDNELYIVNKYSVIHNVTLIERMKDCKYTDWYYTIIMGLYEHLMGA